MRLRKKQKVGGGYEEGMERMGREMRDIMLCRMRLLKRVFIRLGLIQASRALGDGEHNDIDQFILIHLISLNRSSRACYCCCCHPSPSSLYRSLISLEPACIRDISMNMRRVANRGVAFQRTRGSDSPKVGSKSGFHSKRRLSLYLVKYICLYPQGLGIIARSSYQNTLPLLIETRGSSTTISSAYVVGNLAPHTIGSRALLCTSSHHNTTSLEHVRPHSLACLRLSQHPNILVVPTLTRLHFFPSSAAFRNKPGQ